MLGGNKDFCHGAPVDDIRFKYEEGCWQLDLVPCWTTQLWATLRKLLRNGFFDLEGQEVQEFSFQAAVMVELWWSLLGAAVPAVLAGQAFRMKKRRDDEQRLKRARGREKNSDDIFVCERVCTSKRMLKKVGAFSKDPTPDTCVTVCGVSELDACADACARTVCVNQHQVPNWNDICLKRCQSECLRVSTSSLS